MISHPKCHGPRGHICHVFSGRICIERGCEEKAGTLWGPFWCAEHDFERLERITRAFEDLDI